MAGVRPSGAQHTDEGIGACVADGQRDDEGSERCTGSDADREDVPHDVAILPDPDVSVVTALSSAYADTCMPYATSATATVTRARLILRMEVLRKQCQGPSDAAHAWTLGKRAVRHNPHVLGARLVVVTGTAGAIAPRDRIATKAVCGPRQRAQSVGAPGRR